MKALLITILIFAIPTSIIAKPRYHHKVLHGIVTTHASENAASLAEIQWKLLEQDQKLNELLERAPSDNLDMMARAMADRAALGGDVEDLTRFSRNGALRLRVLGDLADAFEQLALMRQGVESGESLGSIEFDLSRVSELLDSGILETLLQLTELPSTSSDTDVATAFELIRGYNLYVRIMQFLRPIYVNYDGEPD